MQVLRPGSRGSDVERVQAALNARMLPPYNAITRPALAPLAVDGAFGPKTQAMVKEFQRLNGLAPDGVVGRDTSFLLFPFIAFRGAIRGHGLIVGRREGPVYVRRSPAARAAVAGMSAGRFPVMSTPGVVSIAQSPQAANDPEPEGFGVELTVGPGVKREFTPWFVLKPEEPGGAKSFTTVTVEGTVLRKKGFEFGGELEFSRQLTTAGPKAWEWEGTLFGKYTWSPTLGPFTLGLGPVAEASIKQGLQAEAALSGEAEVGLAVVKDVLDLTVGGKAGAQWNIQEGNVAVGAEIGAGLKLRWDVVRFPGALTPASSAGRVHPFGICRGADLC